MPQISSSLPAETIDWVNQQKDKEKRETSFSEMICILVHEAKEAREATEKKKK